MERLLRSSLLSECPNQPDLGPVGGAPEERLHRGVRQPQLGAQGQQLGPESKN